MTPKSHAQVDITDEIFVDGFAGGGGWSTGFELATGRPINIAINHDPAAILMHKTNHPFTEHYRESIFDVDPIVSTHGQKVGWAHFSPDCKHFSKAKGKPLVDKHIRGLAWVVLRWADETRPRIISLENVEEFQTWGPLMEVVNESGVVGTAPDPAHSGETFAAFIGMLTDGVAADCPAIEEMCEALGITRDSVQAQRIVRGLGYKVEWKVLVAADYGAPTTRKRLFIIARSDGKPIVWPEPTHGKRDSEAVKSGKLLPWKSAAEIIDWSLPCPSIFESKEEIKAKYGLKVQRPLRPNTLQRVARGVDKHVIKSGRPFIVPVGYGEREGQVPRVHDADDPMPTIVGTVKHGVVEPYLVQVNHGGDFRGQTADEPLHTVTAKHGYGVVGPMLAPVTFPNTDHSVGSGAHEPVHTVTSAGNQVLMAPTLIQYHTEQSEHFRGQTIERPLLTVDGAGRYAVVAASMVKYYSGENNDQSADAPLHTVTTKDREGVLLAHMSEFYGTNVGGSPVDDPLHAVTGVAHHGLVEVHGVPFLTVNHAGGYNGKGNSPLEPANTVTASGGQSVCVVKVAQHKEGIDLKYWPKIREMLNEYCGYQLKEDEILLFEIGGVLFFMADIGLRMLTPRELYRAQGFPEDYIIAWDYMGNAYPKTEQVARCGNAVPPPFATALVRANMPEYCATVIVNMTELMGRISV